MASQPSVSTMHGTRRHLGGGEIASVPLTTGAIPVVGDVESARVSVERQRGRGVALVFGAAASNQIGAGVGAMAFPTIGPVGVVAVRQIVAGTVLMATVRPSIRTISRRQWTMILGLVVVFSTMNLSLYIALERIGLGLAVTLEFLGPLSVALFFSRRWLDACLAILAGSGVVLLANPGPSSDVIGIGFGLLAASSWAAYLLINGKLARELPGLQGTTVACGITAILWFPVAITWFLAHPPRLEALGLAVACGVLCSVVPYAADLMALRRLPVGAFGTLASINPVLAAGVGWILLNQSLQPFEWAGIALIVASNVVVSMSKSPPARARGKAPALCRKRASA